MTIHDGLAEAILALLGIKHPNNEQKTIMHAVVDSVVVRLPLGVDKRLTNQEQICLYWSAKGKSSTQMADLLGIKKGTVDGYKKHILRKLSCNNIAQAVFEGLKLGLLSIHL